MPAPSAPPSSTTNVPKNAISDPAYGMVLMAHIQAKYPGIVAPMIEASTGIARRRLQRLNAGTGQLKYREQVALEQMLDNETVASLHQSWCNTHKPTFWERRLTKE